MQVSKFGPICAVCHVGDHEDCDGMVEATAYSVTGCYCMEPIHDKMVARPYTAKVPENDPGILGEAFPELTEDAEPVNFRVKPDIEIVRDLSDVEIQNPQGVWVPVIPMPILRMLWLKQCHCGKYRLGTIRYQEHYAYAHILGMDN